MLNKPKFHLLFHIADHAKRFGPPMVFATEKFESYNHITRNVGFFTNRRAPSRDIARAFGNWNAMRHMISGGVWKGNGEWVQAGERIREMFHDQTVQRIMCYTRRCTKYPIRRLWNKLTSRLVVHTSAFQLCPDQVATLCEPFLENETYEQVSSNCGEMCKINGFVILENKAVGRIYEIVKTECNVLVLLKIFIVDQDRLVFGCPRLSTQKNILLCHLQKLSARSMYNMTVGGVNLLLELGYKRGNWFRTHEGSLCTRMTRNFC